MTTLHALQADYTPPEEPTLQEFAKWALNQDAIVFRFALMLLSGEYLPETLMGSGRLLAFDENLPEFIYVLDGAQPNYEAAAIEEAVKELKREVREFANGDT